MSNGQGEDAIAARLHHSFERSSVESLSYALVGDGSGIPKRFRLAGPYASFPSSGLINESWWLLVRDVVAGYIPHFLSQRSFLSRQKESFDALVVVGDIFALIVAVISGWSNIYFVGTAKSSYHHPYSYLEAWLLRCFARLSLVRDERTASDLRKQGVRALYVGNAMMDDLEVVHHLEESLHGRVGLAVFPGSRESAYEELVKQMGYLEALSLSVESPRFVALVALANSVDRERLATCFPSWSREKTSKALGLVEKWTNPQGLEMWWSVGCLGDVLAKSTIAFGQAGTANEQAAGQGVPVVAYHQADKMDDLGWYRGRQQGLIGDALCVVPDREQDVVDTLLMLLLNQEERERRAQIGRQRMGQSGGSQEMVLAILEDL